MTVTFESVWPRIDNIDGWLSESEAEVLFNLAASVPSNECIVELGSYRGRSAVALGYGATVSGTRVFSFDPYLAESYNEKAFSWNSDDRAIFIHNLMGRRLDGVVYSERCTAVQGAKLFPGLYDGEVGLLYVDTSHVYARTREDFEAWVPHLSTPAVVAFHDAAGKEATKLWPEVGVFVRQLIVSGEWREVFSADSLVAIQRASHE